MTMDNSKSNVSDDVDSISQIPQIREDTVGSITPQKQASSTRINRKPGRSLSSYDIHTPDELRADADDRASLFSEPRDSENRRMLFDELSFSSIPGNLHLSSDAVIERFVHRYGVVDVVRQLASDLAQREAEVGLLKRQHEDRERELRKMLVQSGISWSDIDKRLMNMTATSIRKPDSMINELMDEAINDQVYDQPPPKDQQRNLRSWMGSFFRRESSSEEEEQQYPEELEDNDQIVDEAVEIDGDFQQTYEEDSSEPQQDMETTKSIPTSTTSYQDRGTMELNDIVPQHVRPPTLLPSWNDHYGSAAQLTDRFGFIYDRNNKDRAKREASVESQASPPQPADTQESQAQCIVDFPNSERSSVRMLLAQLTDLHDGLQKKQTAKWDEFLRKLSNSSPELIQDGQLIGVLGGELLSGRKAKGSGLWKEYKSLVYSGVPVARRPKIWGECCGAWTMKEPGKYDHLVAQQGESEAINQIELDLYRTMPHNVFFGGSGPGVPKLKRVLIAYSRLNPEVGYCQGMNVIAAILLLTYATEEDAFWSLVSLVENILPEGYFSPPLRAARADQQVFSKYFSALLPKLHDHFDALGVEVDAITFDWFLSCFTDALPADALFRVWDVFLCVEGPVHLFRTALALFKMYESKLLELTTGGEIYGFMKNLVNQPVSVDELIRHTNSFHQTVSDKDLKRYRSVELRRLA